MTDANNAGRQTWIRSILDRYEGPLTRYVTRILGDVDLARDVVQETFLRLCETAGPRSTGAWGSGSIPSAEAGRSMCDERKTACRC